MRERETRSKSSMTAARKARSCKASRIDAAPSPLAAPHPRLMASARSNANPTVASGPGRDRNNIATANPGRSLVSIARLSRHRSAGVYSTNPDLGACPTNGLFWADTLAQLVGEGLSPEAVLHRLEESETQTPNTPATAHAHEYSHLGQVAGQQRTEARSQGGYTSCRRNCPPGAPFWAE